MEFKPSSVDPKSYRLWVSEGFTLSSRQWFIFVGGIIVFCSLFVIPVEFRFPIFILIPVLLGVGCIVAESADFNHSLGLCLKTIKQKPYSVWLNLILLGCAPWVPFILLGMLLKVIGVEGAEPAIQVEQLPFNPAESLSVMVSIWFLCTGFFIWFSIPLVAIAELSLLLALDQTYQALELNKFIIKVAFGFAFLSVFGWALPVLIFPWIAITSCTMYVSYRHIWLGKEKNQPLVNKTQNIKSSIITANNS